MKNPATTVFVCPGQGSQRPGMAAEFMTIPATAALFEEADDALGFSLSRLMREGTEEELRQTQNAQPALLLSSMAVWTYLQKHEGGALSDWVCAVAGHSVGEYAAACMAGVLSLTDALTLVRARGEAMAAAVPAGQGAMAAILGGTWADVSSTCQTTGCFIANDNAEGQIVISGSTEAIDEASNILAMQDVKKIMRLNVAGPFHTSSMAPAADVVAHTLSEMDVHDATVPLMMNATAAMASDASTIQANLVAQITSSVRWREGMQGFAGHGVTQVIELGTGKVLSGLAKRCDMRLKGTSLTCPQEVNNWVLSLEQAA